MKRFSILLGLLALGLVFAPASMALPGPIGPTNCSCDFCSANPQAACTDIGHNAGVVTDCTTFFFCFCDETLWGPGLAAQPGLEWRDATVADSLLDTEEPSQPVVADLPAETSEERVSGEPLSAD